jgi:hypothetical protein
MRIGKRLGLSPDACAQAACLRLTFSDTTWGYYLLAQVFIAQVAGLDDELGGVCKSPRFKFALRWFNRPGNHNHRRHHRNRHRF